MKQAYQAVAVYWTGRAIRAGETFAFRTERHLRQWLRRNEIRVDHRIGRYLVGVVPIGGGVSRVIIRDCMGRGWPSGLVTRWHPNRRTNHRWN